LLKQINYFEFVAIETNFLQLVEHAYNLILKGISNIYNVILFNQVLNKRDADMYILYENSDIS